MSAAYLEVQGLKAAYGDIQVLHGIDFTVVEGQIAVILGANGAGKTTTLRALCAMVSTEGSIKLAGEELAGQRTATSCAGAWPTCLRAGGTFPDLSVEENLMAGAFVRSDPACEPMWIGGTRPFRFWANGAPRRRGA